MSLPHGILGFLTYGEMSGYDLAKAFGSSVKFFWHAQNSHIYLELNKLEKHGYVTCELIAQTEKPNKKLYRITESGKHEFLRWLSAESKEFSKGMKNAFLMKIFFSGNVSPEQSIELLTTFIEDCEEYILSLSDVPESIEQYSALVEPYNLIYWQFTADFGHSYMQMCIDWARRCIQKLEEMI